MQTPKRAMGHRWIAPEHLLLAAVANACGASRVFLDRHAITSEAVRASVTEVLGPVREANIPEALTITERSCATFAHAFQAASRRGDKVPITPDDLLLALLEHDVARSATVEAVLERVGMTPERARMEMKAIGAHGP